MPNVPTRRPSGMTDAQFSDSGVRSLRFAERVNLRPLYSSVLYTCWVSSRFLAHSPDLDGRYDILSLLIGAGGSMFSCCPVSIRDSALFLYVCRDVPKLSDVDKKFAAWCSHEMSAHANTRWLVDARRVLRLSALVYFSALTALLNLFILPIDIALLSRAYRSFSINV